MSMAHWQPHSVLCVHSCSGFGQSEETSKGWGWGILRPQSDTVGESSSVRGLGGVEGSRLCKLGCEGGRKSTCSILRDLENPIPKIIKWMTSPMQKRSVYGCSLTGSGRQQGAALTRSYPEQRVHTGRTHGRSSMPFSSQIGRASCRERV